jgi:hypothetical protein
MDSMVLAFGQFFWPRPTLDYPTVMVLPLRASKWSVSLAGVLVAHAVGCATAPAGIEPGDGATEGGGSESGWDTYDSHGGGGGSAGDECVDHGGCPSATPICLAGTCRPCDEVPHSNRLCGERSEATPICDAGRCVECTERQPGACGDDTPLCSENVCVGCVAHAECAVACELDTGRCIDRLVVVDASGDGDHLDISSALETVGPEESVAVQIRPFDSCYLESLQIPEGTRVALMGSEGVMPCITSLAETPVLSVENDAHAYLHRIRIDNAVGAGIEGRSAVLWLDRSEVVNNQGGGVIFSQGSRVMVRNSVVGGDRNHVPALSVRDSVLDVTYATLAAGFGSAVALRCTGASSVEVRNSILVSEASIGEVDCSDAVIRRSALESAFGTGNVAVGEVDTAGWFIDFSGGNLRLDAGVATMFANVARWELGDPPIDLDGDPRPTGDAGGAEVDRADWAGAAIPELP